MSKPRALQLVSTLAILLLSLSSSVTFTATAQSTPTSAASSNAAGLLNAVQGPAVGTDEKVTLPEVVANIISVVLGIVGLLFIGLIIYGGYQWGTARGNEDKVENGRKLIFEAVIGVIIIFGAYFLTAFVIQQLAVATFTPSTQQF